MKKKPEKKDRATQREKFFSFSRLKGLLKYSMIIKMSRTFEKTFFTHKILFLSSVLPQLYKTLQFTFLLAIISKKCRPSLGSAIPSHNFFI
jgi:hypothetical protein